jgi:hypothetical protein
VLDRSGILAAIGELVAAAVPKHSFTSVLDAASRPAARVVNYGVDNYGLDESYLR